MYIPTNSFFNFNNIHLILKKYTEKLESSVDTFIMTNLKDVLLSLRWPCSHRQAPCLFLHSNTRRGWLGSYDELS